MFLLSCLRIPGIVKYKIPLREDTSNASPVEAKLELNVGASFSSSYLIIYAAVAAPVSAILGIVTVFHGEHGGVIRALMILGIIFSLWPYVLLITCPWILMMSSNIGD